MNQNLASLAPTRKPLLSLKNNPKLAQAAQSRLIMNGVVSPLKKPGSANAEPKPVSADAEIRPEPKVVAPADPARWTGKDIRRQCIEHRTRARLDGLPTKTLAILAERFLACFGGDPGRPLRIGIDKDIAARAPNIGPWSLSCALQHYTRTIEYRAALKVMGTPRIDLDGAVVGQVTEEPRR